MTLKPKILFFLDAFYLHFCLAYYLQSNLDADYYGIIDINSKPKVFFQNQSLVNFNKIWFFHDHIKKTEIKPDLDYLINFENRYGIDLWKLAINERFFYKHNRFYKFSKNEILSIIEQESKLFENILDEIKPDYLLMYDPPFHHQKLLLELCKSKDIQVLSICGTGIENKVILTANGGTFDLESNKLSTNSFISNSTVKKNTYDFAVEKYLKHRETKLVNKFQALWSYFLNFDSSDLNSNFMYYGRSKFKVFNDQIKLELKRRKNFNFLQNFSTLNPNLNIPFVYFPMNVDEEMNLLHYAPFYNNQIEVIRHIVKSIPIDYVLFVKEHVASKLRGWHEPDYYKEILEIPNVVLINPNFDNNILVQHSKLIFGIRGTTPLKALKYGKPSIIFGDQAFEILPSIFKVNSITSLPNLIVEALAHKVDPFEYEQYEELLQNRLIEFNMFEYEYQRDVNFFSGRINSNISISENRMSKFLKENKNSFSKLVDFHLKLITS
ncbi:MAG: hypothetical protein CXT78_01470 [Thaumarchaeota archaeon]|jgi:hypothetical protein|nr:MAG: hypothetical protein CXT78_01470 [Nitrososphaerota archaeon]